MTSALTLDELRNALPEKYKKVLNQEVITEINTVLNDPEMYEAFRDNLISYSSILEDGKYRITDYIRAVKYCSLKIAGATDKDAYIRTFPERYQRFVNDKRASKDIASYISSYNKNKMVVEILKQSMIPLWVLNQDHRQAAINKLVSIMQNKDTSDYNAIQAADKLLNHTAPPDSANVQLSITNVNAANGLDELKDAIYKLAQNQSAQIAARQMTVRDVSNSTLGATYDHEED